MTQYRMLLFWIAAIMGMALATSQAQELPNADTGRTVAKQICAECHAVERTEPLSRNSAAPRFEAIAKTPGMTSIALSTALQTSHRTMPNLILNGTELRDVIAYILSLK